MISKILRPSVVRKVAFEKTVATYGDRKTPEGGQKVKKQLEKWYGEGWKNGENGSFVFGNMIPQVYTAEHPTHRSPIVKGIKGEEVVEFTKQLVASFGAEKVATWVNNGAYLGTRKGLRPASKGPSDLVEIEAEYLRQAVALAGGGDLSMITDYNAAKGDESFEEWLRMWAETQDTAETDED